MGNPITKQKFEETENSINHLKKELAFRDGEEAKDDEPVIRRKQSDKADEGIVLDMTEKGTAV